MSTRHIAVLLLGMLVPHAVVHAQAAGATASRDSAVFIARIGSNDTVAVEVMVRDALSADATIRFRTPAVRLQQQVRITPAQLVERVTVVSRQGARLDSVVMRADLVFAGDSLRTHAEGPPGSAPIPDRTIAVPAGAIPFLNLSGLSLELVLRRARAIGGDSVTVPLLVTGASRPYVASIVWLGRDSALVHIASTTLRVATDAAGRFLGGSVAAQRLVIGRLPGEHAAAAWTGGVPVRDYAAPAGAPYTAQPVSVATPTGALVGTLTLPARSGGRRVPAVLLLSGSGPQDRDGSTPIVEEWRPFREIADTLARRGLAVLRLDDRGSGASAPPSAGMTMLDEARDARAVVAWLRARPEIDPERIALVGHSSGGIVAPMVAADDRRLRAVALLAAPASPGRAISEYQVRWIFSQDTTMTPAVRDSLLGVALRQADSAFQTPGWLQHFGAHDPLPVARRVRAPVLVLHGETDRQVPVEDAHRLARALRAAGNARVTVRTYPRTNHLLVDDPSGSALAYATLPSLRLRPELRGALADWLVRTLVP